MTTKTLNIDTTNSIKAMYGLNNPEVTKLVDQYLEKCKLNNFESTIVITK